MRNYYQVGVGTTPKRAVVQYAERTSLAIANLSGSAVVYLGVDNQVNPENGFPINPGGQITFNKGFGDRPDIERWLVAEESPVDVRVIEEFSGD